MYGLNDPVADEYYGQATSDGAYDDVEFYGSGSDVGPNGTSNGSAHLAWLLVVIALASLWLMGAALFKGSNHS